MTADDIGLGAMVGGRKRDFVGKRSLARADLARPGRKQLVGLLTPGPVLDEGAQIVAAPASLQPLGHVTSAYGSATVGHPIALALIEDGRARIGQTLSVPMPTGPGAGPRPPIPCSSTRKASASMPDIMAPIGARRRNRG